MGTLLKYYQSDLQTTPAETRYLSGKSTEKRYVLVHMDRRLPCFDYRRSEYAGKLLALQRLERGESPDNFLVKGVQSIAIDEECAEKANLFFLRNVVLIDPIVSETLESAMRDKKLNVQLEAIAA
ncbi:imm11 family protein [Trinickia fusca]|uniref:Immunity MXAN-0049 protein domain-containing protein n=1 Tax=Trinickia fusca TaxID=2419777 RepID=A0A494X6R6_9BURK|nr:hypothetical protein D7S89_17280 [Trinickia fusca]